MNVLHWLKLSRNIVFTAPLCFALMACSSEETSAELDDVNLVITSESSVSVIEDQQTIIIIETNHSGDDTTFSIIETGDNIGAILANNELTITPVSNFDGSSFVTVQANSGNDSVEKDFNITITPQNDAPIINELPPISMSAGTTKSINIDASDVDSTELTYNVETNMEAVNIAIDQTGALTISTEEYVDESGTIRIGVSDGEAFTTIDLNVTIVDESFEFSEFEFSLDEDSISQTLLSMRNDKTPVTFSVQQLGQGITASITDEVLSIIPNVNYHGSTSITLRASEATDNIEGRFVEQEFNVTVNSVNDSPAIEFPSTIQVRQRSIKTFDVIMSDLDNDDLHYEVTDVDTNISAYFNKDGQLVLDVNAEAPISSDLTIELTDGTDTISHTAQVSVLPSVSFSNAETLSLLEDQTLSFELLLEDDSISNVSFSLLDLDENLTASIDPTNTLLIEPNDNFFGETFITIQASFGNEIIIQTLPINVDPVNDVPVIADLSPIVVDEDQAIPAYQIEATDADNDNLIYYFKADRSLNINISDSGLITFDPLPGTVGEYNIGIFVDDEQDYALKTLTLTINDVIYYSGNDGTYGLELWRTNGTADGTFLVKDINPGGSHSFPNHFTEYNGNIYFVANDGTHGYELWKTDGSSEGTEMVLDLKSDEQSASIRDLTAGKDALYFTAQDPSDVTSNRHIYKTQGTEQSTTVVSNKTFAPAKLQKANNKLYFIDGTEQYGWEVYVIDETNLTGDFDVVKDINSGPFASISVSTFTSVTIEDELVFHAWDGESYGIWKTNGTETGTVKLTNSNQQRYENLPLVKLGNHVYFAIENTETNVHSIYQYLYTPTDSELIYSPIVFSTEDRYTGTNTNLEFTGLTVQNNHLYWSLHADLTDTAEHTVYRKIYGSIESASLTSGMSSKQPTFFVGDNIFMKIANEDNDLDDTSDLKLWATQWQAGSESVEQPRVVLNPVQGIDVNDIYFEATSGFTQQQEALTLTGQNTQQLTFVAYTIDFGWELYSSDGTVAGTKLIIDANPGTAGSFNFRAPKLDL